MRKLAYSLILVLSITLICISCSKENDENDDAITVNDLVGDWNFQSLTFNNFVYDTEPELAGLDLTYSYIQLSFLNVTTTTIGVLDHRYGSGNPADWEYTLSNNNINLESDKLIFYIENWETFDGTVLKLKLLSTTVTNEAPINGIYTMTR